MIMKKQHFSTLAVHAGEAPDPITHAVAPTLVRTKTYAQTFGVEQKFQYSRGHNPTRAQLEEKLAALENAKYATTFASGVAATHAFLSTLSPGDHIICSHEIYGGTYRLLEQVFSRYGITADYQDLNQLTADSLVIKPNTKYFLAETPTNPSLHIVDLAKLGELSKQTGIPFAVDSTFSPPCATRPIDYGAQVVIQSLSKYIAGHNDVIGGALITNDVQLNDQFFFQLKAVGAVLSPDEAYRILQESKTLELRWKHVSQTALYIAQFLTHQPQISRVLYPGLATHPGHATAFKQTKGGFGGVISFELNPRYQQEASLKKFIDQASLSGLITYGESLASPETILAYPPQMSHKSLGAEVRKSLGISDGFFRLSVGFEDAQDIEETLAEALNIL
jgi:cystathionine beta-lyase/cystathionine gamma-synthase